MLDKLFFSSITASSIIGKIMFFLMLVIALWLTLSIVLKTLVSIHRFFTRVLMKHHSVTAADSENKVRAYIRPKSLNIHINESKENHYRLHIDGKEISKLNIMLSVDSEETLNNSTIQVFINGASNDKQIYKLNDMLRLNPKENESSSPSIEEDLDYGTYFENEIEGYRIWFENTHYWRRYW